MHGHLRSLQGWQWPCNVWPLLTCSRQARRSALTQAVPQPRSAKQEWALLCLSRMLGGERRELLCKQKLLLPRAWGVVYSLPYWSLTEHCCSSIFLDWVCVKHLPSQSLVAYSARVLFCNIVSANRPPWILQKDLSFNVEAVGFHVEVTLAGACSFLSCGQAVDRCTLISRWFS